MFVINFVLNGDALHRSFCVVWIVLCFRMFTILSTQVILKNLVEQSFFMWRVRISSLFIPLFFHTRIIVYNLRRLFAQMFVSNSETDF